MAEKKIYLVPMGKVESEVCDSLKGELARIFSARVEIFPPQSIPGKAFNARRRQYNSTTILNELVKAISIDKNNARVLAVIDVDLYVEGLNFVFGEADPGSGFCIISLARLRQEFYGLPKNKKLFYQRVLKEAVHELGHTYGLPHCLNPRCVMYFSNSLQDTDRKDYKFCPLCQKRLTQ